MLQPTEVQNAWVRDAFGLDPGAYEAGTTPTGEPPPPATPELAPGNSPPKIELPTGTDSAIYKKTDQEKVEAAVADWNTRLGAITITYDSDTQAKAFGKAAKEFQDLADAGKFADAAKHIAAVEKALVALEKAAKAVNLPERQKKATAAGDKIDKMSDDDIGKMSAADKAALVKEMLGAGQPTGKIRDAQRKLYRDTDLDPDFRKVEQKHQQAVADELKGDKELAEARKNWATATPDDITKALTKVVKAQSKVLGITPPKIVVIPPKDSKTPDGHIIEGFFDPSDGMLHINMLPESSIHDFTEALDTVLHENAHNWQHQLVAQLHAGKLKKGDPLYNQALMFEANSIEPGGYIEPDESVSDYQKQPLERHSWETGPATAGKVIDAVKPPATGS
ncbi:MAG TPA: hypothetical protein VFW75_01960 [Acetobacteraceae bacterium]|nr:hypothetical protein [Acetobacteraceae bacterium]